MNKGWKEVKRKWQKVIDKLDSFCRWVLIVLLVIIPIFLGMEILNSGQKLEDVSIYYTPLGKVIIALNLFILLIILPILSKIFPKDCNYIIIWHEKKDYFYVLLPEVNELDAPLRLNRKFHMCTSKTEIHINDGITVIDLSYDKEVEKLLEKFQKQ